MRTVHQNMSNRGFTISPHIDQIFTQSNIYLCTGMDKLNYLGPDEALAEFTSSININHDNRLWTAN
jgi:hypothetical protein